MEQVLKGKNAVVTGGGGGIGRAVCLALASHGANVVVNDIVIAGKASPADKIVAEIKSQGGQAIANYDNVADFEAAGKIIKSCIDTFGRIDILVNVAGIIRDRMCFNMSFQEWDDVIKVCLYGVFNPSCHACVAMREQKWGRIISFSSDAYRGVIGHVNYSAAKGGIVALMRGMALELAKYGVTCNSVCPSAATRMTLSEDTREGYRKRFETGMMDKATYERVLNMPGPEFVAPMVVYLASDLSAKITGSTFTCAGGKISIHTLPGDARGIYKDYIAAGPWTIEELTRVVPAVLEPLVPPIQAISLDWG